MKGLRMAIEDIADVVADAYGISRSQVLGSARHQTVTEARLVAYCVARDLLRASYPELARAFNRNHSTVIAGEARLRKAAKKDRFLLEKLTTCRRLANKRLA